MTFGLVYYVANPIGVVLGRETPETYLARVLLPRPDKWMMRSAMRDMDQPTPGRKYYLIGSFEAHYWPGLAEVDMPFRLPRLIQWAGACPSTVRLRIKVRQENLSRIVFEEGSQGFEGLFEDVSRWPPRSVSLTTALIQMYCRPVARVVHAGRGYSAYDLLETPLRTPLIVPNEPLLQWWRSGRPSQ